MQMWAAAAEELIVIARMVAGEYVGYSIKLGGVGKGTDREECLAARRGSISVGADDLYAGSTTAGG